jgi:N-acetyl-D-muramate 6-phosphate phosphatase
VTGRAVLFDLDGTLVDTAPDLIAVLNRMLLEDGRARMPFAVARSEASNGALGLVRLGYGRELEQPELDALCQRFRRLYTERLCVESSIFNGLNTLIDVFYRKGTPWGIVTNKPHAMTVPLLERLGLEARAGCVVSGDRLPQKKPHPAPLLLAAAELGVDAQDCIYVGDAPRDVEAGRAAGMTTVAAAYGYISPAEDPRAWRPAPKPWARCWRS